MLLQITDEAHTVSVMACHSAVFFHNYGIAGADQLCCRRQMFYKPRHLRFARHSHIESAHVQGAECIKRVLRLLQWNIKSKISAVQTELLKAVILHGRGTGMSHRRTDQSV